VVVQKKPQYAYIDCVRGYAVLLVIICHLTYEFADLPYPVHRLTITGWHGVQLFFLASCVTLLMSWHHELSRGAIDVRAFFIRRFFRIAPAYYAAAGIYYFLSPPAGGVDGWQLLATLGFANAWHPLLTPTVADRWMVVPGGWSIGVEFTFYFLFPLIALSITSLRRAILFFLVTIGVAALANGAALAMLADKYTSAAVDNFLYFWLPNQMSVFALGTVLFFLIRRVDQPDFGKFRHFLSKHGNVLPFVAMVAFAALAYVNLPQRIGLISPYIPMFLAVCVPFMAFVLTLSAAPDSLFINPFVAAMGKVSFSAYLLHFAVLRLLPGTFPEVFQVHTTGYRSILAYAVCGAVVVPITYAASWCTYRLIEQPMMNAAKSIIHSYKTPTVVVASIMNPLENS
jgi:peptidoglycan/LPS O-acetylase OafA/YrhL